MRRLVALLATALAVVTLAAGCEPTEPPAFARRSPTPAATARPPGDSGAPTADASPTLDVPTGSPRIEVAGDLITIVGQGDKNTDLIELDGTYEFSTTACPGTGVIPFVWVYEEFGQGRGTYVDAVFTVKNLVGKFYLRVAGPPRCAWTVTVTKG